ncbi:protein kinase [bacterium]|nr:protein kinase [bacterium]MBP9809646.1 protein kinase [bacterium]
MKLCLICNFQTAGEQDICPRDGSSMVTVGDDPLLGMVVEGRYKIQSVIGQGSAGTVYRAVQELIGREVAVKVLHDYLVSDDEFIKRFKQEAKASSRLNHPNIITIYDFGVIPQGGGRPYIAMDLLNGTPLSDFIAEVNHIPPIEAVPIFTQVCAALAEAHRQGVVHRDIKPENIVLVERGGQKNFPIVVDFGIARLVQEESDQAKITRTGTVCGSPTYMSPEQCTSSKVDHRSDIYSLGIVFYESLTGEVPFQHDELVRVMAMHLSDTPLPLNEMRPDLNFPEALMQVVHKTLLKNPNDRYQTMDELSQALEDAMKEPEKPSVATTQTVHKDIAPGPLAQDETLQHRKESREMLQQRPLTREMLQQQNATNPAAAGAGVSHAGEESRSMSSNYADQVAAYRDAQRHADVSNSQNRGSTNFSAGRGGATGAAQALRLVPIIITVLLIGAAVVFALTSAQFQAMMPWNKGSEVKAVNDDDPEALIKAGKLAQAVSLMKAQKTQGKLPQELTDKYYTTCVSLGKLYMKDKKYTEAIAVLQQVPAKSSQGQTAKNLLAKAKKQAH